MSGTTISRNRTELETQLGRAFTRFEKEFMGRGPLETKAYLIDDMILIRLKGVLTAAEQKLSASQRDRSAYLVKQVRNELLSSGRPMLEAVIRDIVGVQVQSVHTDISTRTGERIIVVTLEQKPDFAGADREGSTGQNGNKVPMREGDLNSSPYSLNDTK